VTEEGVIPSQTLRRPFAEAQGFGSGLGSGQLLPLFYSVILNGALVEWRISSFLSFWPWAKRRGRISSFFSIIGMSSFALLRTTPRGIDSLGMTKKEETLRAKALRVTSKKGW